MTLEVFTSLSREASMTEVTANIGEISKRRDGRIGDGEGVLLAEQPDASRAFFSDGGSVFIDPNAIRGAAAP